MLFADVRSSTALGEKMPPASYAAIMNRFYRTATEVLVAHDAVIDKMIGDEVMALFIPGMCMGDHRTAALTAGVDLLRSMGYGEGAPWLSVGVGIHAGPAFVGNVGGEAVNDFTALGDTVNTAARLQAEAGPGELVVSDVVWSAAEGRFPAAVARLLQLRGRQEPVPVWVVGVGLSSEERPG